MLMRKKVIKVLIVVLTLAFVVQGVFSAISLVNAESSGDSVSTETDTSNTSIVISDEVQQKIKESDPENFEQHIENYKNLLITFNVHVNFKNEIERLILEDYKIWDLMVAYEYLFHQFGLASDLEIFVTKKEQGTSWETIFLEYVENTTQFIPRAFETEYLEQLMSAPGVSSDDIMIADRVSFITGQPFDTLITAKMEDQTWQEINAQANILYSSDLLPRVQVTSDQLEKFTQSHGMTEEQVVEGFVLANKVSQDPKSIIDNMKSGYTQEEIFAESYTAKYR
jgi:hypothetical protein